jgi:hypothetical protein
VIGIRRIYLEPGFLFITNTTVTTAGVLLITETPPPGLRVFSHHFFFPMTSALYRPEDDYKIAATFRDIILSTLPQPSPPRSALFAHVRGGDLFLRTKVQNPKYGQPPCGYYTEAVDLDNATEVRVIAEDAENPCLEILLSYTGAIWRPRDIRTDLADLIYAGKMILGRGTFGKAILFLSPLRKTVFYSIAIPKLGFGRHFDCITTRDYTERVLHNWENQPWQLSMMQEGKCRKWNWLWL